jgi:hypothetical protein
MGFVDEVVLIGLGCVKREKEKAGECESGCTLIATSSSSSERERERERERKKERKRKKEREGTRRIER